MHAALLAVIMIAGGGPAPGSGVHTAGVAPADGCTHCSQAAGDCVGHGGDHKALRFLHDCLGPMPQTCYSPRYGCYPGNTRCTHRYPAFHGYYERQAYNYRHDFEYPWHAAPHEPQDFFTFSGAEVQGAETVIETKTVEMPAAAPAPAAPTPAVPPLPPMPSGI